MIDNEEPQSLQLSFSEIKTSHFEPSHDAAFKRQRESHTHTHAPRIERSNLSKHDPKSLNSQADLCNFNNHHSKAIRVSNRTIEKRFWLNQFSLVKTSTVPAKGRNSHNRSGIKLTKFKRVQSQSTSRFPDLVCISQNEPSVSIYVLLQHHVFHLSFFSETSIWTNNLRTKLGEMAVESVINWRKKFGNWWYRQSVRPSALKRIFQQNSKPLTHQLNFHPQEISKSLSPPTHKS